MSEEKTSGIDIVKNYLPLASIVFLSIGMTVLIAFYKYFDIDIIYYIEFTEILQIQFVYFALVVGYMLIAIAMPHAGDGHFGKTKFAEKRKSTLRVLRFREKKIYKILPKGFIEPILRNVMWDVTAGLGKDAKHIMVFVIMFGIFLSAIFIERDASLNNQIWCDALLCLSALIFILYVSVGVGKFFLRGNRDNFNYILYQVFVLFIVCAGLAVGVVYNRAIAYNIQHGEPEYMVKLRLKEKSLISDSSFVQTDTTVVYVGQTKNYIFIYDRTSEASHVIPKSEISGIQFSESSSTKRIKKRISTYEGKRWHWSDLNKYFH